MVLFIFDVLLATGIYYLLSWLPSAGSGFSVLSAIGAFLAFLWFMSVNTLLSQTRLGGG